MELKSEIRTPEELLKDTREEMLNLLKQCFVNIRESSFRKDLEEKDEVCLLKNREEKLCGFSTAKFFTHHYFNRDYLVMFSGDTIIAPKYWGSLELPIQWGVRMSLRQRQNPSLPMWWMLISKGIRTYKLLPACFIDFYPCPDKNPSEEIQGLMNSLGSRRFPRYYEAESGLLHPGPESYFLRDELADIPKVTANCKHVDYFVKRNPDYRNGSELLCLSEFRSDNLRPFIRRQIEERLKINQCCIEA